MQTNLLKREPNLCSNADDARAEATLRGGRLLSTRSRRRGTAWSMWGIFLVAAVTFAVIAPVVPRLEFTGGMENANVATALEAARDGHWLIPTLNGEPRTEKPPLAEWITAMGILSSHSLAWGARWPTFIMACLAIVAVGCLGRILAGPRVGLVSAIIYVTTGFFLKFSRQAAYDMPLALFVVMAQVFVARALFRRDWLKGGLGAGICLGLALMTKGPVALLEVLVPALVYVLATRRRPTRSPIDRRYSHPLLGIAIGTSALLMVSLPWTMYAAAQFPDRLQQWTGEVTRQVEVAHQSRSAWYDYICVVPHMFPWAAWLFVGATGALVQSRPSARRIRLALFWFIVPLLVMSFFPARRDRYALPMAAAGSVLAAWGLCTQLRMWRRPLRLTRVLVASHFWGVALIVPSIAVIAVYWWHTPTGNTTCSFPVAGAVTAISTILVYVAWRGHCRGGRWSLLVGTGFIMLIAQAFFIECYRNSDGGRSAAKPFVESLMAIYPNLIVYNPEPGTKNLPTEFSIYLNAPVIRLSSSARLVPGARPQIILQPSSSPMAEPPEGFSTCASAHVSGRWFHAYLLSSTSQQ
ncbi:MAG: glycosyltransferase [Phycisphaerales bacterium]|nr:glycosyltransferase [Phycisphaerales bacterium]